jgi:rubrerythrin
VSALVKNLTTLESTIGEEYFTLVQVKTLLFMTKEIRETYDVDLEDVKDLLASIIRDEEKHEEILSKIKKILMGKESEPEEKTPAVTYKNPDVQTKDVLDKLAYPLHE